MIRLLSFVEDPRALAKAGGLKKSEKKWLRNVESLLAFDDPALTEAFARSELERAEQAYQLLLA